MGDGHFCCSTCFTHFMPYTYGTQLVLSSGFNSPVTNSMISTIHHIPSPPRESSFPTAVPVCPRQKRSRPRNPNNTEYKSVVKK